MEPEATTTHTPPSPPPLEAELHPTPPPPQLNITAAAVKQENRPTTTPPLSQQSQEEPKESPNFVNSIEKLRHLSDALSVFHRCYDDLQTHLDSISSAIESKLTSQLPNVSPPVSTQNPFDEMPVNLSEEIQQEKKEISIESGHSEVESLCATMSSKDLRKYLVTNLGDLNKLREVVPKALTLAPNPAKLVLECFGRFFLQGSKAYIQDSPMIPAREASAFVLECFLLMERNEENSEVRIETEVKKEAEDAAVAWKKRLFSEGGLSNASEFDARGLLLLLGCFGIPREFRHENLKDLIRAGNVKEISGALKRSKHLMAKIQDVIEAMVKNKRVTVDAIDLVYTFGLEDKFTTQTMLTSFLRESKELWKKTRNRASGSLINLNEANKMQLAALKSVVQCLERHNLDPSKILPGWQISSQISKLEKEISEIDTRIRERTPKKRKADDPDSSKQSKHSSQRNFLNRIPVNTSSSFASHTLYHGTGSGLLPGNISGSVTVGTLRGGVASSTPTVTAAHLPTDSYPGVHGEVSNADRQVTHYTSQPYLYADHAAYNEQPTAYAAYNEQPIAYVAYNEQPTVYELPHSYGGQASSIGLTTLYRPRSSLEEYSGLPSSSTTAGASTRGSAGNLYQFAETIDSESYYSRASHPSGAVPAAAAPPHHSSRLY